jgi:hypothetical protein
MKERACSFVFSVTPSFQYSGMSQLLGLIGVFEMPPGISSKEIE